MQQHRRLQELADLEALGLPLDADPFYSSAKIPQEIEEARPRERLQLAKEEKHTDDVKNKPPGHIVKINMANSSPEAIRLRDVLPVVPEFDGRNSSLSGFLDGLREAKAMLTDVNEPNFAKLVRSRFKGEARRSIVGQEFDNIEQIAEFVKNLYAPARSVHQLLGELGSGYQEDNESVLSYANKMREIGSRILETKKNRIRHCGHSGV